MVGQRRLLVAGNWKMNGSTEMIRGYGADLVAVSGVELVLLPPALYLTEVLSATSALGPGVTCGVQDVHQAQSGAFTGDVSAEMAADLDAQWAVVGHSERREYHAETDEVVAAKLSAALAAGLQPIVCVGESLSAREAGDAETTVAAQIDALVSGAGADAVAACVLAYEPIWAIGTGVTATPEQADGMHAVIRGVLTRAGVDGQKVSILYGGSVNADNAAALFAGENIDGALVGGASLRSGSFVAIARALAAARTNGG